MAEEEKANVEETSPIMMSDFDSLEYMLSKTDVDYEITETEDDLIIEVEVESDDGFEQYDVLVFGFDPKTGSLEEVW